MKDNIRLSIYFKKTWFLFYVISELYVFFIGTRHIVVVVYSHYHLVRSNQPERYTPVSFFWSFPESYCWTNKKLSYSLVKVVISLLKLIKVHHKDENNYNTIHSSCCNQILLLVCFKNCFMFVKLLFQKTSKNYSNHIIFTTFSHNTCKI
jgi:hypothetical protein